MINTHYYGQESDSSDRSELARMKRLLATMKRQANRQPQVERQSRGLRRVIIEGE
jgi:hypothetical protein